MPHAPFLITLSPAKRFHDDLPACDIPFTQPLFLSTADQIAASLKTLRAEDLKTMMSISDTIANLNVQRFQSYQANAKGLGTPAAYLFAGDAYRSLEFQSLQKDDVLYAQDCLMLLSGLYGLLRPLDLIQPYRLEMGCNTQSVLNSSLYQLWQQTLVHFLSQHCKAQSMLYHLNLASSEYAKAIPASELSIPTIDLVFATRQGHSYKVIGIKAKKARGTMARYLITHRIQTLDQVQAFQQGYTFSQQHSTYSRFVFLEN